MSEVPLQAIPLGPGGFLRIRYQTFGLSAPENPSPSVSLLSSLELSDTQSLSLKYEPASEPLLISVK